MRRRVVPAVCVLACAAMSVTGCDSGSAASGRTPGGSAGATSQVSATGSPSSPGGTDTQASQPTRPATSSASPTVVPPPSSTPTSPVTETPSTAPTSAHSDQPLTLVGRLLSARRLPVYTDGFRWRATSTIHGDGKPLGSSCQQASLTAIGAAEVVRRDYRATGGDRARATQFVARFVDTDSVRRAYAVVTAWQRDCEETLRRAGHHHVRVDDRIHPVRTEARTAGWWLATYRPAPGGAGSRYLDAQGVVATGRLLSWTAMVNVGRRYDYPPGSSPIARAVRRSAHRLVA